MLFCKWETLNFTHKSPNSDHRNSSLAISFWLTLSRCDSSCLGKCSVKENWSLKLFKTYGSALEQGTAESWRWRMDKALLQSAFCVWCSSREVRSVVWSSSDTGWAVMGILPSSCPHHPVSSAFPIIAFNPVNFCKIISFFIFFITVEMQPIAFHAAVVLYLGPDTWTDISHTLTRNSNYF